MTNSSSDAADEEHFFFTQADKNDESEEQTFEQKEQSRKNSKQLLANDEPSSSKTSVKEFAELTDTLRRIPWNQNECTNTSRLKCRPRVEEIETENPGPTTPRSANKDRLTV